MEIERKFMVKEIPADLTSYDKIEMDQRYVSVTPTIRIRKENELYVLTVKGNGTIAKEEFEMHISKSEYLSLRKKVIKKSRPVIKTRYLIPLDGKNVAELDVYYKHLKGLYTVEVEFDSLNDANAFTPPKWFGKELTEKKGYGNASLSTKGLPCKISKPKKQKYSKKKKG